MEFQKLCKIYIHPYFFIPWFLLIVASYFFADLPVTLYFNGLKETCPFIFKFFSIITNFGIGEIYILLALLMILGGVITKNKRFLSSGMYIALAIFLATRFCEYIKVVAGRARPILYFKEHLYGFYFLKKFDGMWSFPSGHTTVAFAAATAFSLTFPRFWGYFYTLAFLVGFSRIVILMHYLSDVMTGFYLGFIVSYGLYLLFERIQTKAEY